MKIKKVSKIKDYKSFRDFDHRNFIKNNYHEDVNLFFGENGSGKSCVSNILKSLCPDNDFNEKKPFEVKIKINDGSNKELHYINGAWVDKLSSEDILCFDSEFISKNIHSDKDRSGGEGGAEQNSAKLIINFSEHAMCLRELMEDKKKDRDEQKKMLQGYESKNKEILKFNLTREETELLKYKKTGKTSELLIEEIRGFLAKETAELESKEQLLPKDTEIRNIKLLFFSNPNIKISLEKYSDLFNFNLKENTKEKISQSLRERITRNKDFFVAGINIIKKGQSFDCPFCLTPGLGKEVEEIVEAYESIYDDEYNNQLIEFQNLKQKKLEEIKKVIDAIERINFSSLFFNMKRIETDFNTLCICDIKKEKEILTKQKILSLGNLIKLRSEVMRLGFPDGNLRNDLIKECIKELTPVSELIMEVNELVKIKNNVIKEFKRRSTKEKLNIDINVQREKIKHLKFAEGFWNSDKIKKLEEKGEVEDGLKQLKQELNEIEKDYTRKKKSHEEYCGLSIFKDMILKIQEYFEYFNFNFTLDFNKKSGAHKTTPFSFTVRDSSGSERSFREGLSEGELQVLAICFFFAFLDTQSNQEGKIVILDDPITSLDSGNLYNLSRLIRKESDKYSQLFILTHHAGFDKNVRKVFGDGRDKLGMFYIIKNKDHLGGSFVCERSLNDYKDKLEKFQEKTYENAKAGGLDLNEIILTGGQTLRYGIEDIIKNKLLHWGKDGFDKIIDGIKHNQNIDELDLEKLKNLYRFCNWSNTSHVDKEEKACYVELESKIKEFLEIYAKVCPVPQAS